MPVPASKIETLGHAKIDPQTNRTTIPTKVRERLKMTDAAVFLTFGYSEEHDEIIVRTSRIVMD